MKTIEEWKVAEWKQIEIELDESVIFYKPRDKKNGFDFKILEAVGKSQYVLICHGNAFYDGIRHMYFGEDEENPNGYLHYPIYSIIIEYMKQLEKLEKQFCSEV